MKLKLTTLTPLHIGNGNKWYPFEYWKGEGFIWIGNFDNFSDLILSGNDWEENYKKLMKFIQSNIKNNRLEASFWAILNQFGLADVKEIQKLKLFKKSLSFSPTLGELKKEVDQFICHPDLSLFIPGSSVKGAIRTAFLHNRLKSSLDVKQLYKKDREEIEKFGEKVDYNSKYNIQVADVEFGKVYSKLDIVKRIGMAESDINSKKNAELNGVEVIEITETDNIYVDINSKLSFEEIKRATNNFYSECVNDILEIDSVRKNNDLVDHLSNILTKIETDNNSIFMQLGKYGNYFTKSLGSLIKDEAVASNIDNKNLTELREVYNFGKIPRLNKFGRIFPKTFSVTSENKPFGWIKFTLEEQ